MPFAPRHARARWPFRVLAFIIFALGLVIICFGVRDALMESPRIIELLQLAFFSLFTFAAGFIAVFGKAPKWFLPTDKP